MDFCRVCRAPSVGAVNTAFNMASSVPSNMEPRCADHMTTLGWQDRAEQAQTNLLIRAARALRDAYSYEHISTCGQAYAKLDEARAVWEALENVIPVP
jgi:hypothetical protein